MTREELEECVGYEVVVREADGGHFHGVLVSVVGVSSGFVEDGRHGVLAEGHNITCLALLARRHQEKVVREHLAVIEDPKRPPCTCPEDALTATCPRHGARAP